jgi:threonine/homoserine/homoserine lactone efflux protein
MSSQLNQSLELSHETPPPAHLKPPSSTGRITLALIGGTVVWGLYFMFVYSLTSLTCVWSWFGLSVGNSGSGLKVTQAIATVIALGLLAFLAFVAFREWRSAGGEEQKEEAETIAARNPMLAFVTMLVNVLYILIIAVSFVPIFILPVCFR